MIQMQTILEVADNSGAKKLFCIKVLGGSKRKYAGVGDVVVCSVREALPNSKVKKVMLSRRLLYVQPKLWGVQTDRTFVLTTIPGLLLTMPRSLWEHVFLVL